MKYIHSVCYALMVGCCNIATAESQLGGHVGVVHPLVTFSDKTTSIADQYKIGFPMGITFKQNSGFAIDFEFVPFVDEDSKTTLLVHPGLLWSLGDNWTFGTRAAFEIDQDQYGFTPLLNKSFMVGDTKMFGELVVPVRFSEDSSTATTLGFHVGVAF